MGDIIPLEALVNRIYVIRGQKVIFDRDLAGLYDVKTKALNQAVKRNKDRFPPDFVFSLTREEILRMSQIVTSLEAIKYSKSVYAFTEQGVAMLSSVLKSKKAVKVNIMIMRAFVKIRELLGSHKKLAEKIEQLEKRYDKQFSLVFSALKELIKEPEKSKKKEIGFRP